MTISFKKFIYGMMIFELYPTEESTGVVPCIFRVGPNRFIEALADPEHMMVRYMYHNGDKRIFVSDEKADFTTKYCKPFFDAPSFLKERDIPHTYCDKDHYRWNKKLSKPLMPNSYLQGKHGVCFHSVSWLDIEIDHSDVYFLEDALTLFGKKVDCISWSSFDDADSATGKELRPLIQNLLNEPHQFDAEDLYKAAEHCNSMHFHEFYIKTDFATFRAERGLCCELSIGMKNERLDYALPKEITARQMIETLISLLEANSQNELLDQLNQFLGDGTILLPRQPKRA